MSRVVPTVSFNPDPDARYHRSLLEAFPVCGSQPLLLRMEPRSPLGHLYARGLRALRTAFATELPRTF